jgi:predicted NAD-dependent protein-ADP-ribosyltransferase YbiA (DUF1768 family)
MEKTLNITSKSDDLRARILSNFSGYSFTLDGLKFASVEGFIQGTKFPENDPRRNAAFGLMGKEAKKYGTYAERKFVWWGGKEIPYASEEHRNLIERAIRAKFNQSPQAIKALLATRDLVLIHDTGEPEPPDTSLPASIFCRILMDIREEKKKMKVLVAYQSFDHAIRSFVREDANYLMIVHTLEPEELVESHVHTDANEWIVVRDGHFIVTIDGEETGFSQECEWIVIPIAKGQQHSLMARTKVSYFVLRDKII